MEICHELNCSALVLSIYEVMNISDLVLMLHLIFQMVQCGMGRCGFNSSGHTEADEKMITEDDIVAIPKVSLVLLIAIIKFFLCSFLCIVTFLNHFLVCFDMQKQESIRRDSVDSPKIPREKIEHPQMSPLHEMSTSESKVNRHEFMIADFVHNSHATI